MKKVLMSVLAVGIMSTSFQSNAAVGLINVATGGTGAIVLAGLATEVVARGVQLISPIRRELYIGLILLGLIVLDGENGQEIQFKKIPESDLSKIKLTKNEAIAFNSNTEELTEAFRIVSSQLTAESKAEDAKELWSEQESILGSDAINGARKVLAFTLNNN